MGNACLPGQPLHPRVTPRRALTRNNTRRPAPPIRSNHRTWSELRNLDRKPRPGRNVVTGQQRRRNDHVRGGDIRGHRDVPQCGHRSSAFTSVSCGWGSGGSQKKIIMSISPSAIFAPICWSPPIGPDRNGCTFNTSSYSSSVPVVPVAEQLVLVQRVHVVFGPGQQFDLLVVVRDHRDPSTHAHCGGSPLISHRAPEVRRAPCRPRTAADIIPLIAATNRLSPAAQDRRRAPATARRDAPRMRPCERGSSRIRIRA